MATRTKSSHTSPSRLATSTDLTPEQVQAVCEAVNPLIADSLALYVKTKNFHWHVSGAHFRDLHLLFDEQAEVILDSVDVLAERVRRIGGTTLRSISHIGELQTIADNNEEFVSPEQMVQELLADNRHMAEQQRAAVEVCEKNQDVATSNRIEEVLDGTERRIWFLFEITQDTAHATHTRPGEKAA